MCLGLHELRYVRYIYVRGVHFDMRGSGSRVIHEKCMSVHISSDICVFLSLRVVVCVDPAMRSRVCAAFVGVYCVVYFCKTHMVWCTCGVCVCSA